MDPRRRTLRRVRVSDAASAESMFELLMGGEVAPRKEFIVDGAAAPRPQPHRRLGGPGSAPLVVAQASPRSNGLTGPVRTS